MARTDRTKRLPPGPRGLPFVGSAPSLIRDPLRFCERATEAHGDVVRLGLGVTTVYLVSHPRDVKYVLQSNAQNFGKGKAWEAMRAVVGHSLATADGKYWLKQRRTIQPAFHRLRLSEIAVLMRDAISAGLERWEDHAASGEPVDVLHEMKLLTRDAMLRSMFSTSLTGDESRALDDALPQIVDGIGAGMWASFLPDFLPVPGKKRFLEAVKNLDRVVYRVLSQRRGSADDDANDLVSLLLCARDRETGEAMNDQQLRDELVGLFLGAFETTSLALAWTWYALHRHEDAAAALRSEVDGVDLAVDDIDFGHLGVTRRTFEESMRRYPPGWVIPRQAIADDTISGFDIPAGAIVLICSYLTHRHPAVWDEPDRFDPDRFLPENAGPREKAAFIPFGMGPRQCIGNYLAVAEAQLILALLARRYRLELAADIRAKTKHVTIRPSPALMMRVRRRDA